MQQRLKVVLGTIAVATLAFGGVATAADTIGSNDVTNNSLKSKDIHNNSLKSEDILDNSLKSTDIHNGTVKGKDLSAGLNEKIADKGSDRVGDVVAANVTTSASSPGANATTGLVPVPIEESSVFTAARGVPLISTTLPAGHYIVSGSALFFDVAGDGGEYGEARLFTADGTPQGSSIFSGAVPPAILGGVGALASASVEINLTTATTITLRARLRGGAAGPSTVQGGANLLVTKVA